MIMNDLTTSTPATAVHPLWRTRRRPQFATDQRGEPVALIPLANGAGTATVDRADYDRLVALRVSMNWVLSETGTTATRKPAVKVRHGAGMVGVARLILDAPRRSQVRYRGADRTDLRRSNIHLKETMARGEGERVSGIVNASGWTSIAGTMTKDATVGGAPVTLRDRIAAERVEAEAADRAASQAASIRVARIKAEIEARVAAGADRDTVTAEGMAQARAERRAYDEAHGLVDGRHPRPLSRARQDKAKAAKAARQAGTNAVLPPEAVAALPFKSA